MGGRGDDPILQMGKPRLRFAEEGNTHLTVRQVTTRRTSYWDPPLLRHFTEGLGHKISGNNNPNQTSSKAGPITILTSQRKKPGFSRVPCSPPLNLPLIPQSKIKSAPSPGLIAVQAYDMGSLCHIIMATHHGNLLLSPLREWGN